MKSTRLSNSPLTVTEFCLGTMTWGEQNSEPEAHAQIEWALDHGINFIDTAEMYPVPPGRATQGLTERYIGNWLTRNPARRDQFVLASKIAGPGRRDWIRDGETHVSAKTIPWAIDDSLKRLSTDYIDLFQIHWPERNVPMFGTWRFDPAKERADMTPILEQISALAAAIDAGKIRAYGLSNETCFGLCEFAHLAQAHGLPAPVSVQNSYSLISRMFDGDLAEASYRWNIPLLAYSPLAMGLLSGKYRVSPPPAARLTKFPNFGERYRRPLVADAIAEYLAVADKHGVSPTALALAFVRSRWFVASTILGATSLAQLDELAGYFDLELATEILADIDAINARYPSPSAQ